MIELYPFQREGVNRLHAMGDRGLLADDMGLGKLQPLTGLVLTPNGWVQMGSISVGDAVIGSRGDVHRVTGVFPQGNKDIYRVRFTDGTYVECGLEHLWAVNTPTRQQRGQEYQVLSLGDMLERGVKYRSGANKYRVPRMLAASFPQRSLPVDPYLLGVLIANGYLNQKQVSFTINVHDVDEVLSAVPPLTCNVRECPGCVRFCITGSKDLRDSLRNMELLTRSGLKHIPAQYLAASIDQRLALLRGLMDCDGSCSRNRTMYSTTSERLAEDVAELGRSLGGVCVVRKYDRTKEGKPVEWQVNIRMFEHCPFSVSRKAGRWSPPKDEGFGLYIDSVEYIGEKESQCISVSAADSLYVAENYKVTHNTTQALVWAKELGTSPTLVVCPASLKYMWQLEAEKKMGMSSLILSSRTPMKEHVKDKYNLLIINYEVLPYWEKWLRKQGIQNLICDEAHMLSNRSTKRSQSAQTLGFDAKNLLLLSGTPMMNRPKDLWHLLHMIDREKWHSFVRYALTYCEPKMGPRGMEFNGAKNLEKLHAEVKPHMVRRHKAEVLKDLPEKTIDVVPLDLKDRREYDLAENDFRKWLREQGKEDRYTPFTERIVKLGALKRLASKLKFRQTLEWIEDWLSATDEKLVVFGIHKKMMDALERRITVPLVKVTGSTTKKKRQKAVEEFQGSPDTRVFLGNIEAAGVGLTLTAASTVVFTELDWRPTLHAQAIDRCLVENQVVPCLSPVYTEGGTFSGEHRMSLKSIQHVEVGDVVLTHTGDEKRVTDVSSHLHMDGRITTIKYTGWGDPVECTFDHKWLIRRKEADDPLDLEWVQAHRILPGDEMVMARPSSSISLEKVEVKDAWRKYSPAPQNCVVDGCHGQIEARSMCRIHYRELLKLPVEERPAAPALPPPRYVSLPNHIEIDDEWLFLFGLYAAEGFSSIMEGKGAFVSVSSHRNKEHLLERCAKVFARLGVNAGIYRSKQWQSSELRAHSTELANWFMEWFGHTAEKKSLPKVLMDLPPEQASVLLDGYVTGDGYYRNGVQEWTSASETLAYQFAMLAAKCGYSPTMRKVWSDKGSKYHYVAAYAESSKTDCPYVFRRVRSVTTSTERRPRVYDVTVEDDHSFVTGFATAHNCHRIGQKNAVVGHYLIARNTIEERLAEVLQSKQETLSLAIDGQLNEDDIDIFDQLISSVGAR